MRIKQILLMGPMQAYDSEIDVIIISNARKVSIFGGNQDGDYALHKEIEIQDFDNLKENCELLLNDIKTDFFEGQFDEHKEYEKEYY